MHLWKGFHSYCFRNLWFLDPFFSMFQSNSSNTSLCWRRSPASLVSLHFSFHSLTTSLCQLPPQSACLLILKNNTYVEEDHLCYLSSCITLLPLLVASLCWHLPLPLATSLIYLSSYAIKDHQYRPYPCITCLPVPSLFPCWQPPHINHLYMPAIS